jgi:hypothetical protein
MAEYKDREHFIPIRRSELLELLCADKNLKPEERDAFRQFVRLIVATLHYEDNQRLEELKDSYAPFDPDRDTKQLTPLSAAERQHRLNDLFCDFSSLMVRAGFKHMTKTDLEPLLNHASNWGVLMDVDFSCFEQIAIFCRGDSHQKRTRRRLFNLYRLEECNVDVFQRLVLILKLRKHRRLPRDVDTESVYLKVFKDIPKLDVSMMLPGARVRMSKFDRSQIGLPLLTGLGVALWNISDDILRHLIELPNANPMMLWGIATGAFGYGYRSWYGYAQTKKRYHLTLTQSLYYQNLDSNGGVLFRLIDEAEEQDSREAILAYYFLWRYAGQNGWDAGSLDDYIEMFLEGNAGVKVDFEIHGALANLERLKVIQKVGNRYRAVPIDKALEMLDWTWDNYFKYNNPAPETPPVA